MVQIIDNWAEFTGIVRSIAPSHKGPEHRTLTIEVDTVDDVEGFPNLMTDAAGAPVQVVARTDVIERSGVQAGQRIRCRARKATPIEIFVHPDGLALIDNEDPTHTDDDADDEWRNPALESND